jgi:hypothetical protein
VCLCDKQVKEPKKASVEQNPPQAKALGSAAASDVEVRTTHSDFDGA